LNNAIPGIYDSEKSTAVLDGVKKYSLLCRNEYNRLEELITDAADIAEIDVIKAGNQYTAIVEQYNSENNENN
jgi:hypothetical protein